MRTKVRPVGGIGGNGPPLRLPFFLPHNKYPSLYRASIAVSAKGAFRGFPAFRCAAIIRTQWIGQTNTTTMQSLGLHLGKGFAASVVLRARNLLH